MNNPKAFPCDSMASSDYSGMDLRDYFASRAMQSIIINSGSLDNFTDNKSEEVYGLLSGMSYRIADTMLKAREEK